MKFLLSLSFLLFAAAGSINASSFFAEGRLDEGAPILDTTGAPLQFGAPYYMLTAIKAQGGGVTLEGATPSNPCPKGIQLTPENTDQGTPVVFSSSYQDLTGNITEASVLIISFYNLTRPNDCGVSNSTKWGLTNKLYVALTGKAIVDLRLIPFGATGSYSLKLLYADFAIGVDGKNLVVFPHLSMVNLSVVFQEAKSSEEDEDDKPVIIQMPRKMSV